MKIDRNLQQELAIGGVVFFLGLLEVATRSYYTSLGDALFHVIPASVVVGMIATAAALFRRAPGLALVLTWTTLAAHVIGGFDFLFVEVSLALVAFGVARYGTIPVVWTGGLSIPLGAIAVTTLTLLRDGYVDSSFANGAYDAFSGMGLGVYAIALGLSLTPLAIPYAAGLVLRSRAAAEVSRTHEQQAVESRVQAEELAAVRAEQTRLAHDVHDVVGHSLAVILAQAESAQFIPDDDPARLKDTMATIATSARQSLQDVRHVLATGTSAAPRSGGLDELIAGVRDSGQEVVDTVLGQARPLPPELETLVYRTLQEMLTNALKHGERSQAIRVLRHWSDGLTLAVENTVAAGHEPGQGGLGLAAMEQRLTAAGGRLDVREDGGVHTVTATIPLRAS